MLLPRLLQWYRSIAPPSKVLYVSVRSFVNRPAALTRSDCVEYYDFGRGWLRDLSQRPPMESAPARCMRTLEIMIFVTETGRQVQQYDELACVGTAVYPQVTFYEACPSRSTIYMADLYMLHYFFSQSWRSEFCSCCSRLAIFSTKFFPACFIWSQLSGWISPFFECSNQFVWQDTVLPSRIPLLWCPGSLPSTILASVVCFECMS